MVDLNSCSQVFVRSIHTLTDNQEYDIFQTKFAFLMKKLKKKLKKYLYKMLKPFRKYMLQLLKAAPLFLMQLLNNLQGGSAQNDSLKTQWVP